MHPPIGGAVAALARLPRDPSGKRVGAVMRHGDLGKPPQLLHAATRAWTAGVVLMAGPHQVAAIKRGFDADYA